MVHVDLGGLLGDPENPADLPVGPPRGNQRGDLPLPRGERHLVGAVRVTGCGARSDRHGKVRGLPRGHCPASVHERVSVLSSQRTGNYPLYRRTPRLLGIGLASSYPHAQRRGRTDQPGGAFIVRPLARDMGERLQALGDAPGVVEVGVNPQSLCQQRAPFFDSALRTIPRRCFSSAFLSILPGFFSFILMPPLAGGPAEPVSCVP